MNLNLTQLLQANPGVTDYRIIENQKQSYEAFFVHKQLETVRTTFTTDTSVTVYVDHDGKKGDATFSVYASTTKEEFCKKVEEAVEKASMIDNQYYTLPENETLERTIPSNFANYDLPTLAQMTADAAFRADSYENGSINALEIFINQLRTHVVNSRGIDKTEIKYNAMIEAIPTWNTPQESVELYERYVFNEFNADEITAEIDGKMQEVRYRSAAQPPKKPIACRVVLPAQELASLAWDLAGELNYAGVYAHSNAFSKGDAIQKDRAGDALTITMKSEQSGCCAGAVFDGDGITLKDTEIIRDGVANRYYGSNRFAQYLGEEITGNLPCLALDCGTMTDDELKSAPYFTCVSMSGLQVDIYNDYIGGEVRLAYYWDGETIIPLTGISISGKLSDALRTIRLSDTTVARNSYRGPSYAVLENISIV